MNQKPVESETLLTELQGINKHTAMRLKGPRERHASNRKARLISEKKTILSILPPFCRYELNLRSLKVYLGRRLHERRWYAGATTNEL